MPVFSSEKRSCCRSDEAKVRKKCKVIRKKIMNTLIMQVELAQLLHIFSAKTTVLFWSSNPNRVHLVQLNLNHVRAETKSFSSFSPALSQLDDVNCVRLGSQFVLITNN
jgi:hypothetical protein